MDPRPKPPPPNGAWPNGPRPGVPPPRRAPLVLAPAPPPGVPPLSAFLRAEMGMTGMTADVVLQQAVQGLTAPAQGSASGSEPVDGMYWNATFKRFVD
eukprot:907813-Alexandrium_andersonii.AAC.1